MQRVKKWYYAPLYRNHRFHVFAAESRLDASPATRLTSRSLRTRVELHQPDVAPEIAEHQDDLVVGCEWRSPRKVRGHHHLVRREYGYRWSVDESIGGEMARPDRAANHLVGSDRGVIQ